MNGGSMDNDRVRVVNVDTETVLAVIYMPDGHVDIKAKVSREEAVRMLRETADAIESER